jgi:transposase
MSKKIASKEDTLRKRVYTFADLHPDFTKSDVVKHFSAENVPRSTLFQILQRKANNIGPERKVGTGRKATRMTPKIVNQLKKRINNKDGISQRQLASEYGVCHQYMGEVIKTKSTIKYRKKIKVPNRSHQQKLLVRPKCRLLVKQFRKKKVVIDDESYLPLSNDELSANAGFYTSDIETCPDAVKLKPKSKYDQKVMVWISMSEDGLSKHYMVPSGQAINQDIYIQKCLKERLIPFIKTVHKNDEIVFWPDLASAHYAKKTQDFLRAKKVEFVPREHNPANVPELRPIEDFWSELKRRVYARNWKAKNIAQLRTRINYCIKNMDTKRVRKLGKRTFTRVDKVRRHGMKNL